jgi:hypothetical protein
MNEDTTKAEILAKMQAIQDAMQKRYQAEYERYKAWFLERRQKVLDEVTARRQPGILDRIRACESSEEAHTLFYSFLDSANCVSQKTINRATRLLATLDFPLP